MLALTGRTLEGFECSIVKSTWYSFRVLSSIHRIHIRQLTCDSSLGIQHPLLVSMGTCLYVSYMYMPTLWLKVLGTVEEYQTRNNALNM